MTFKNVLQSVTSRLERVISRHAAKNLPLSIGVPEGESRLHLYFDVQKTSSAAIAVVTRNPHASEGTRHISTEIDAFTLTGGEIDAILDKMVDEAVALLEEDVRIIAADEDPLSPPAHRYRCHPALLEIARFNGWSLDDLVKPATIDDDDGQHIVHSDDGMHTVSLVNGCEPHVVRLSRILVRRRVEISYLTLKDQSGESPVRIQIEERGGELLMTMLNVELAETLLVGAVGRKVAEIVNYPTFGPVADIIIQSAVQKRSSSRIWVELSLGGDDVQVEEKCR